MATAPRTSSKRSSSKKGRRSAAHNSTESSIGKTVGDALGKVGQAVGRLFSGVSVEYDSLRDFFLKELQDLYSAEQQLVEALPKMAKASASTDLRKAFEEHLVETRRHVTRLEQVFREIREEPEKTKCKAMAGLVAEGDEWIKESAKPGVKDVGLIAAAQRVEHYEMAGYGCVRTYAQLLGYRSAAELLQATLDEEGAADKKLTQLSKKLNVQADGGAHAQTNGSHKRTRTKRKA